MSRTYKVIDADGHVLEPISLWRDYMDPAFRDRGPRLALDESGKERLIIDNVQVSSKHAAGIGQLGALGARDGVICADTMDYAAGRKGGFDPHARIPDMDLDGIDAAVLYPSLGLFVGSIEDPSLAAAVCRAYNRWLADYCKPYPDRLFGMAILPLQSLDLSLQEMHFARHELGFPGGLLRPNPYHKKMPDHPDYERFWATAEDLDFVIGFHQGSGNSLPMVGADRFTGRGALHIISQPMEMELACLSVVWGGVCQRHPKIRIAFLESGGGWVAPLIDRMDRHFDDRFFNDSVLKTRPSELFRRNCWISFEPVEGCLSVLADYIGPNKIMWATDYPHPDGFFPGAPTMVKELLKNVSPETRHQVLAGGAMSFYGLG